MIQDEKQKFRAVIESQKGIFHWSLNLKRSSKVKVVFEPFKASKKQDRSAFVGRCFPTFPNKAGLLPGEIDVEVRITSVKVNKKGKTGEKKSVHVFDGRNIRGIHHIDTYWLYTLSDTHEYHDNQLQRAK
jgi:hypothetical protein